jgi:hypothetical protein
MRMHDLAIVIFTSFYAGFTVAVLTVKFLDRLKQPK